MHGCFEFIEKKGVAENYKCMYQIQSGEVELHHIFSDYSSIIETNKCNYKNTQNVFNQIIGVIACAFSFCAMVASFSKLFGMYSIQINIGLMICTITWILKDIAKSILLYFVNKG